MKKVALIGLILLLGAGCSSEISPQEKRNNYDVCIIEKTQAYGLEYDGYQWNEYGDEITEWIADRSKNFCVKFLK